MRVGLELFPVAARIGRGHSLRLTLAPPDTGWFEPLTESPATSSVAAGAEGSTLSLPLRRWTQ
jgi:hypothetical protein